MPYAVRLRHARLVLLGLVLVLSGCSSSPEEPPGNTDPAQVDSVEVPELGACRLLTPDDVAQASNATRSVDCAEEHTAQTYAVGQLPAKFDDVAHDDETIGGWAYDLCSRKLQGFLGADESLVMRTTLSWAWFRPSAAAWDDGARWYRCDVVGGGEQSKEYVALPETAEGLLLQRSTDPWMVCATGRSVSGSVKVPCSEKHDPRAVTAIKLGEREDRYPEDRLVEVRTRDFCSDWVGAYLNYPVDFDFGYTYFHEAEWEAGNRRSVCWAKTSS